MINIFQFVQNKTVFVKHILVILDSRAMGSSYNTGFRKVKDRKVV